MIKHQDEIVKAFQDYAAGHDGAVRIDDPGLRKVVDHYLEDSFPKDYRVPFHFPGPAAYAVILGKSEQFDYDWDTRTGFLRADQDDAPVAGICHHDDAPMG